MKRFYFTNPTDDHVKAREIQLKIEKELKGILELDNPFYNRAGQPTEEIRALSKGIIPKMSKHDIVGTDMSMVTENEGVVAWITNRSSWGSIQEACIAYREQHKPVYLIFDPRTQAECTCSARVKNQNNPSHPWARAHSVKVFNGEDAFIDYAKKRYGNYDNQKSYA